MDDKVKRRQSNFELLRIIAMLMIIILHFFSDRVGELGGVNTRVYYIYESFALCGVNIFVLLTGYFSLNQNYIKLRRIADLLIDVAFWSFISFLLCVIVGWRLFDLKDLVKTMLPILFGGRWFVKAYIILLCLVPFINRTLTSISKQSYLILLAVSVFLFSVWPSYLPNPPIDDYGYGFVHFILIYAIAGYLRLHVRVLPQKWICIVGFLFSFMVVIASKILGNDYAWAYNYPFVILEAVCLFMLFTQIKIESGFVNILAANALGVYLLHTSMFFNTLGYERLFHASEVLRCGSPVLPVIIILCAVFFYILGFVLEMMKRYLFRYTLTRWLDKAPLINNKTQI